jgi:Uma2 family endonuclease
MNAILPTRLTVDEFLRWSLEQDRGRYELEEGRIVEMSPQNAAHAVTKVRVFGALAAAIEKSGLRYYAMPDGMTVRITGDRAYEPDALIAALPRVDDASMEVPNAIAVFEVLSPTPSSIRRDLTTKLRGYAMAPSIEHYVVIDPAERIVFRFRREAEQLVAAEELADGVLRLDPPGLEIPLAEMLMPAGT